MRADLVKNKLSNFGYLDTETTGISKTDQVVEVSLIDCYGKVLFNSLVRPTVPVNKHSFNVHKIENKDLKKAPLWKDICEEFNKAAQALDTIYIYNEAFDRRLLSQSYSAHGLNMPEMNFVCALKIAKAWMKGSGFATSRFNLDLFCERTKVSLEGVDRHRAMGDCILMKRAFDAIGRGVTISSDKAMDKQVIDKELFITKDNSIVSNSHSVDSAQYIKRVIDNTLYVGIDFVEYVNKLEQKGINVIPVISDEGNPAFKACYYEHNKNKMPGSKIGKLYSVPKIINKGLIYEPSIHGKLVRELMLKGRLSEQKDVFLDLGKEILKENYKKLNNIKYPLRVQYVIKQRSRVFGIKINAKFSSFAPNQGFSHTGQYSVSENSPKSIRLRELSFNNIAIKFEYHHHLDKAPSSVEISSGDEKYKTEGAMCVSRAVSNFDKKTFSIVANYLKANIESEIYSIKQVFFCSVDHNEVASLNRFADKVTIEGCTLIPILKDLQKKQELNLKYDD